MYCYNCGKEIEDTAKFCNFCGVPIKINSLADDLISDKNNVEMKTEKNNGADDSFKTSLEKAKKVINFRLTAFIVLMIIVVIMFISAYGFEDGLEMFYKVITRQA